MFPSLFISKILDPGNTKIKPGLERMHQILSKLGNPEQNYSVIHITGTNGKGSTASFIAAGLNYTGKKVGKFISPHILRINECISISKSEILAHGISGNVCLESSIFQEISDADLIRIFYIVHDLDEEYNIRLSPFEFLTVIMFYYMAEQKIDYLVLEVGMGGATDSTNVVDSMYAVITNVTLEHTQYLGSTLEQIAVNKSGIIKPKSKVIIADNGIELHNAVLNKTKNYVNVIEKYQPQITLDTDNLKTIVKFMVPKDGKEMLQNFVGTDACGFTRILTYKLNLYGTFQAYNFLCAYEIFTDLGLNNNAIEFAAKHAFIPYRLQVIERNPLLIYDIAHNLAGAQALYNSLHGIIDPSDVVIIVAILKDKDVDAMLKVLANLATTIILTTIPNNPRALLASDLYGFLGDANCTKYIVDNPKEAVSFAQSLNKKMLLVTGSSYIFPALI